MPGIPIYTFEPNPSAVQTLKSHNWGQEKVTIFPIALGSQKATLPLNISRFSPASSLLRNSQKLAAEFPEVITEKTVDVNVERLDTIFRDLDTQESNLLLKIDVQGFEMDVLKGSTGIFDRIIAIICEVNLASLYEQQCTLESILTFLQSNNYQLIDIGNPVRSHATEEALYLDLAFISKRNG